MHLLNPAALWLLPLALVPLLLARRQPPRRRIVSTLDLWTDGTQAAAGHASRKRPLDWIVLLQVLFIIALAGALARPVLSSRSPSAVLIVDVSASMGARDTQGTRLDAAKAAAHRVLDALGSGTVVHVVAAGVDAVETARGRASDGSVRRGLDNLGTSAGASRLAEAIAVERLREPGATLFVFSDASPVVPDVRWTRVGHSVDNIAVTSLTARRLPYDEHHAEASISVANFGMRPRRVHLTLRGDAEILGEWDIDLAASGNRTVVTTLTDPPATLAARIDAPDDGIVTDNERVAVVPDSRGIRVALLAQVPSFVEQALATNPDVTVERLASGRDVSDFNVAVCTCTSAPPSAAAAIVVPPAAPTRVVESPITVVDLSHPLAAGLDTGDLRAAAGAGIAGVHDTVVARAGAAPILFANTDAGRRIVTLNVDLRSVSLAVSPAFPIVIANAIDWLVHDAASGVLPGEPLRTTLPTTTAVVATGPSGRPLTVHRDGRFAVVEDTHAPGVYIVSSGPFVRRFAVNPPREESDLSMPGASAPPATSRTSGDAQASSTELRLWLLLLAAAAIGAEWCVRVRRGLGRLQPSHAVVGMLLILFGLNVAIPVGRGPLTAMFAIDQSLSVPVRAQRAAVATVDAMMHGMKGDDRSGIIVFGGEPLVERRLAAGRALEDLSVVAPAGATNIESAIDLARAAIPRGGHVVLLSDGRETTGDATRAAGRAARSGVRIDAVPLATASPAQAIVAAAAPQRVHAREPFRITVTARGAPSSHVRAAVVDDSGRQLTLDVPIGADGTGQAMVAERLDRAGVYTYRAVLDGTESEDLAGAPGTAVTVDGTPSLLYVTPDARPALPSLAGFSVTRVVPTQLPADSRALAAYDAVVIDDVPAAAIDPAAAAALASYVTNNGGGLLVTGSGSVLSSLAPDSAIGGLLPVNFRAKSSRRGPSVAYVLIVDKSGSMADKVSGISKMELARESAARLVGALPDGATLGVVAFDATPLPVMPLAPLERGGDLASRLRAIEPGGSTRIAPAAQMAAAWLAAAGAPKRRALLMSDGRSTADDAARLRAVAASHAFELSVVAIGRDADRDLLGAIARETGGRAYFPDDLRSLPQIVAGDAADAAGRAVVQEHFVLRAAGPHPILGGIAATSLPAMDGYVVSTLRPGGEMVLGSHLGDPVLAAGRAGLGRVAVFTSDLRATWTAAMRRWPENARLWNQAVHWTGRRMQEGALEAQVIDTDTGARLLVDAIRADGTAIALAQAHATIRTPAGTTRSVALVATAPGRYEADVPLSEVGTCEIVIDGNDAASGAGLRLVQASYWSGGRERRMAGADRALLAQIAAISGGRVLNAGDTPFSGPRPLAYRGIGAAAGVLALLLYLLDLAGFLRARRSHPQSTSPSRVAA